MKKFRVKIALILVLSLTLAAAIPALAATTTKIVGKYEPLTIEVVIPNAAQAVINPFGLPQAILADDGRTSLGDIGTAGDLTIVTRPLFGYNLSKYDLQIGASVTEVEERGDFKFGTAAAEKTGVVNFELKTNTYAIADDTKWLLGSREQAKTINEIDGAGIVGALDTWPKANTGDGSINITDADITKLASNNATCTVKAATLYTDPTTKKDSMKPGKGSIFLARLNGDVVKKPTEEWTTQDGMNVTIAWTIELAP